MNYIPPQNTDRAATSGTGDPAIDNPEAIIALAFRSFKRSARRAIEENARIGHDVTIGNVTPSDLEERVTG